MIIQDDLRHQFYEAIKKEHILMLVNADVDGLCAAAILTHILSCDEVTYSLKPVDSLGALKDALAIHGEQAKNVLLINCVGSASALEMEIPENVTVWILESRRPIHLDNIYNESAIKVIAHSSEINEWEVPDASQIYGQEESSDEEEEDVDLVEGEDDLEEDEQEHDGEDEEDQENLQEPEGGNPKRRHMGQDEKGVRRREELANVIGRRALKRQQRAQWRRTRGTILWEYYMKSWYASPVSVLMLELAHELGKSSAELMWCATVAISSQYMDQLISLEKYTEICADRMRTFIRKYGPRAGVPADQARSQLRISFNKELVLPLYAHWSLYESMSNELIFICQSKLWSQRGEERFKEILSELGLTLAECQQNYEVMPRARRQEVFEILAKYLDTGFTSFNSHLGYNSNYNALDFARVLSLQLEYKHLEERQGVASPNTPATVHDLSQRFESANGILREFFKTGGRGMPSLARAIDHYKLALRSLNELVKRSIVQKHVVCSSRYFLLTIPEQCPMLSYFSSRHFSFLFIHSMLRAHASLAKTSRRTKPFIVAVPMAGHEAGWYLVTGVMPLAELMADPGRRSIIGSAFKHVAKEASVEIRHSFDPNVIMIRAMDRFRFFSNLDARLESV